MSTTGRVTRKMSAILITAVLAALAQLPAVATERHQFNIGRKDAAAAIHDFGMQTGLQIVADSGPLRGKQFNAVLGEQTTEDALRLMLEGTGLTHRYVGEHSVALMPEELGTPADSTGDARARSDASSSDTTSAPAASFRSRLRLAQANSSSPTGEEGLAEAQSASAGKPKLEEVQVSVPEILVTGNRSLNMDIRRSRDDVQPYVIYGREAIEQSGATSVDEFLRQRLPMTTSATAFSQLNSVQGALSSVNLRGLGASQTLILVDGHRIAEHYQQGSPSQSDLNGIPVSAIERIEVLPTTASGIYGGGATGGVVNVILKRNYTGFEVRAGYENTFDTDAATRRFDLSGGLSFNDGKTSLSVAGSYRDGDRLHTGDRDFLRRARERFVANNPAVILPPAVPPLGATSNIRSVNGANLTLKQGSTPLNSSFTSVPAGYAGIAGDNGMALLANAGRYNLDLADSPQVGGGSHHSLMHDPTTRALMLTLRQEFHPRVKGFVEAAANESDTVFENSSFPTTVPVVVRSTAPNNPFEQDIQVVVPVGNANSLIGTHTKDRRLVGGVIVQLPWNWKADADYVWSKSEHSFETPGGLSAAGTAAIANGMLDVLRDTNAYPLAFAAGDITPNGFQTPSETVLKDASLRFAGPVGRLPGGTPTLSLSFQHRDQEYGDATQVDHAFNLSIYFPSRSQSVDNVYAELKIPVVSELNRLRGVQELEVQLAGRYDEYTVRGVTSQIFSPATPLVRSTATSSSTNPTLGLRWKASQDLMFRASYGTGFLPPTVNQVLANPGLVTQTILDPLRGKSQTAVQVSQYISGGNPNLKPERSISRSAGIVLTPRWVPDLRVSVDYSRIDKTDNVLSLALQTAVDNEAFLPGRIQRGPKLPGDPAEWAGPITFIDSTLANLSRGELEAYDVAADYRLEAGALGAFDFFALGTWQPHFRTQVAPNAPMVENAGVSYSFPLKLRANAGVTWTRGAWSLGWTVRYLDSYLVDVPTATSYARNVLTQGSDTVPSQTYHDLFGSYRFDSGLLSGAEIQAGIQNVFNREPPFDARNSSTFSYYSPFGDPRLASYRLALKWAL